MTDSVQPPDDAERGEQPAGAADAWAMPPVDPHWAAYGNPGSYGGYGGYGGYGAWRPPGTPYAGGPGYGPPPPAGHRTPRWSGRVGTAVGVAALLVAGGLVGAGVSHVAWSNTSGGSGSISGLPGTGGSGNGFSPFGGGRGGVQPFGGNGQFPGGNGLTPGSGNSTGSTSSNRSDGPSDAAAIARNVDPGVVDITTTLTDGVAAGTGMVLTSSGEVLTNNHVIDGARSISVRDVGNGKTYTASVVGYDRTDDIAVLQLHAASGLTTIKIAASQPGKGAAVVGIGNAGGTGGIPSYAGGAITGTDESITASSESDGTSERLNGLLQTDAGIEAGDSGGPLVDASGQVVGMDTAASESQGFTFSGPSGSNAQGFAIPISRVLSVARQIEARQASSTVHIGPTAELGVYVSTQNDGSGGVAVAGVTNDGPADRAGLTQGDVIDAIAGVSVSTANALSGEMTRLRPGQTVTVVYTGPAGQQHSTRVTLASGPPQ